MSARRRRGEDEFADERPWLADDDEAGGWLPDAEDDWADGPDQAPGDGRRGRHSVQPGAADPGDWDATASLPRQAGPHGRPGPGAPSGWQQPEREEPGYGGDDSYAPRRDSQPPAPRRAAPWDDDPRAADPYQGRNGLPGERYPGQAGQQPGPGAAGRQSRPTGRRAAPDSYQDSIPSAGYRDSGDRYAGPGGADPLPRPSGRGGDPAGAYGGQAGGGRYGAADPARYRDPGGQYGGGQDDRYGGQDGQYADPGGQYRDQSGWDREAGDRNDVPGGRGADPGGRYRDPADRPEAVPGRRPAARGGYAGAGDGYPPPGRGGTGGYPEAGARRAGPDDEDYPDEYGDTGHGGRRAYPAGQGRDPEGGDSGWDDEAGYQQDEGWPFGGDSGGGGSGRKRRKRRGRWAGPSSMLIVAAIILIPLIAGGIYAYRVISSHYDPPNYSGNGTGTVLFQVKPGDNSETVGERLVTDGVVASSRALVLAAEHSSNSNELEPGTYRLHKHMSALAAWNLLLTPSARVELKVTIPEGLRESQILAVLGKQSGISASDFTKAIKDTSSLGLPSYAKGKPEGYLFPDTYDIQPNMSATSVLKAMVTAFNQEAASVDLPKAAAHGNLTPAEAIVVASLAQAEGGKDSDFPKITRVIYNRLQAHMPLDLDSTVLYALNKYGIAATDQDLKVKSPYNTYAHQGLPPAPIDSPGAAAIQAALHPAKGGWLYFVTVNPKTKQTDFTSSPAVFQQYKNQLQQYLSSHGG